MKRSLILLVSLLLYVGTMWAQTFPETSTAEAPKYYTIASYSRGGYLTSVGEGKGVEHIATTKGSLWYFVQADENGGLYFCNMAGGFLAADKTVSETAGVWYVLSNGVNTEGASISSTNPISSGSCVDANNYNTGVGAWHPQAGDWEGTTWVFVEVTDFSTIFNVDEAKAAAKAELDVLASVSVIYPDAAEAKAAIDAVEAEGTGSSQLSAAIAAVNQCVDDYKAAALQALGGRYFAINTPARESGFMKLAGNQVSGATDASSSAAIWQFEYADGVVKVFNPYTGKYLCEPGNNSAIVAVTENAAAAGAYQLVVNAAAENEEAKVKLTSNGKSIHMDAAGVLVRWDDGGASEWTVAEVEADITKDIVELLEANAGNHAAVPALGQYSTAGYTALQEAQHTATTFKQVADAVAAFEATKCLSVFTIDGVYNYALGMSVYESEDGSLLWRETERTESMLWTFDMTDTIVGVTDKVVVRNLATGNLFWGASFIQVTETSEAVADDGLFLFYTEGTGAPVHAAQAGQTIVRWNNLSANSASAWQFTFAGTTYSINDLPEVPDTPVVPDTPEGVVNDLASADATKCYSITTMGRGGWTVDAAGTLFTCTTAEGLTVDDSDPRQQFAILSLNAQDYYLYSVSAKKFVKRDGSLVAGVADAIEFVDASSMGAGRVMVRFDEDHNINVSDVSRCVEINTWSLLDEGNAVAIIEAGDFDATEALAMLSSPVVPDTSSVGLTDLSAADPTKCYTISTNGRGAWAIDTEGTRFSTTGVEGFNVDAADARQQFAILSANAQDYYLYSVSAKKFVKQDRSLVVGAGDAIEFVDASSQGAGRVMVRFRDIANANINIGGDNQMVINSWGIIDGGNAMLIAVADDFDASEALAQLTDPEAAELNALIAQALELVEANADNHAVEPALGQYATEAYEYLDSVAHTPIEYATKNDIERALSAFEASKCLPVFTIDGVYDYVDGKSIYENGGTLYWKNTDRTDRTMLWTFDMTNTVVGVTDRVVVKNLATGNYFDDAFFVQIAPTQDSIAVDGVYLIYPEGMGLPLYALSNGRVNRAYSWSANSPSGWKFTYVGTTYGANTPHRDALEVLLYRAKGYNPYSGSELGYYVEDFSYLLEAIAEAEELLLGEPSEAECEAMVTELSQAVEQFESSDKTFRLPEPGKAYRIVSAFSAFYELQSVEKAITISASDNTLWWGDVCPDSLQQEFVFEPVLGDSGVHLSWNMNIGLSNGTTVSETQYFYNMKHVATGLYAGYNDSEKYHLSEQPCTVYLTCLGVGQFGLRFRVENEYGGGSIHCVHAGDHNNGVPSTTPGNYGGIAGISSGIVSWYGGFDTASAWYIRECPEQTDTVPSLQLMGVTPDSETSQAWVRALTLSFNKEVYVWSLSDDIIGMDTGEEFHISSHRISENSDGGFDLTLYFCDADDGWTDMITVPDTYTYTISAGSIKSVDGEELPETTVTFTVDGTFSVANYSPAATTSLEQVELTFDRVIEYMNIYYGWYVYNEEGDRVAYIDRGSGHGSKTVTLGLNTPITTPGKYYLHIFADAFRTEGDMPNMPTDLTFTVIEDTPAISTDYVMKAQDVKGRTSNVVNLPIEMDNATEVIAFQFDLYLPEGVSVATIMEDDETFFDITLNKDRAKNSHVLAAEPQADGALRIAAYSTSNALFAGNSGVLADVALVVGDLTEGDYSIVMRNIRVVTADETEKLAADHTSTLTIENTLLGDVNSDGRFTMIDVVMVVNAVLEKEQTNFNADAADLNGDGQITMVDVVGVLRLVLTDDSAMAPARSASRGIVSMPELSACEFCAMDANRVVLPVALDNVAAYSAFQMDVVLPTGVELAEATLTGRAKAGHAVAWNTLSDGTVRIVAYAMDNNTFRGNEGDLLNLVFSTSEKQLADAEVTLTDALFATADGEEHRAADVSVMMRSETTGIDGAYTVFRVYGVEDAVEVVCGAEMLVSIYATTGELVQQAKVQAGKSTIALPSGVYIVNGNKVIVK